MRSSLKELGADYVFTYEELAEKSFRSIITDITGGSPLRLALNCVSGPSTTHLAKLLSANASLVTYGAMSRQPLSLPSSLFIFKGLKSLGFWMTTWYARCSREERRAMTDELVDMARRGKLKEPEAQIVALTGDDDEFGRIAREAIKNATGGQKLIFRWS